MDLLRTGKFNTLIRCNFLSTNGREKNRILYIFLNNYQTDKILLFLLIISEILFCCATDTCSSRKFHLFLELLSQLWAFFFFKYSFEFETTMTEKKNCLLAFRCWNHWLRSKRNDILKCKAIAFHVIHSSDSVSLISFQAI